MDKLNNSNNLLFEKNMILLIENINNYISQNNLIIQKNLNYE